MFDGDVHSLDDLGLDLNELEAFGAFGTSLMLVAAAMTGEVEERPGIAAHVIAYLNDNGHGDSVRPAFDEALRWVDAQLEGAHQAAGSQRPVETTRAAARRAEAEARQRDQKARDEADDEEQRVLHQRLLDEGPAALHAEARADWERGG